MSSILPCLPSDGLAVTAFALTVLAALAGCEGDLDSGDAGTDGGPTCVDGAGGCGADATAGPDAGAGGAGGAGEADAGPNETPQATLTWDGDTLHFRLTSGLAFGPYFLGLAETGNGNNGWYGEDCDLENHCHPLDETGALVLAPVATPAEVDETHTLFRAALAPGLTYMLLREREGDQNCWTWGHHPDYFVEANGCTVVPAPPSAP